MPTISIDQIKGAIPEGPEGTENIFLPRLMRSDFVEFGDGGIVQFKKDIVERKFMCAGIHFRDRFPGKKPSDLTPHEITSQLREIFAGSDTAPLIEAHGQRFASMISEFLFGKIKDYAKHLCLTTNPNISVNLFKDEMGNFKVQVTNRFDVSGPDGKIGEIGPVTSEFNLVNQDGKWGYQLAHATTDDALLLKMMQEKALVSADEVRMHCNPKAVQLEQEQKEQLEKWKAACIAYEKKLSEVVDDFIQSKGIKFSTPPANLEQKLIALKGKYNTVEPIQGILADYRLYKKNFKDHLFDLNTSFTTKSRLELVGTNFVILREQFKQPDSIKFITFLSNFVRNLVKVGINAALKIANKIQDQSKLAIKANNDFLEELDSKRSFRR